MAVTEQIMSRTAQLPSVLQREVLDFVEFLAQRAARERETEFRQAASAGALAEIWDNEDDDVYAELTEADYEAEEKALVAAGLLRLPVAGQLPEDFWEMPAPDVPLEKIRDALQAERDAD